MKKTFILIVIFILLVPTVSFADFANKCVEGDCVNGKGTQVTASGHKYIGMFKDGLRHGEGIMLMPGKRKIVAVWEANDPREGTYTAPDGTVYKGQWEFRERDGQGTLIYPDGRKYIGAFKNGLRHGKGTMTWLDGRTYVGDFRHSARTGNGTMTYPDGKKYTGEFKDGERHGRGTLVYADGKTVEGEFKNGDFVGK